MESKVGFFSRLRQPQATWGEGKTILGNSVGCLGWCWYGCNHVGCNEIEDWILVGFLHEHPKHVKHVKVSIPRKNRTTVSQQDKTEIDQTYLQDFTNRNTICRYM